MIQIDMPMPTNCLDCPACNEYLTCAIPVNGRGFGENDVKDFSQCRPEWCPLKEQEVIEPVETSNRSGKRIVEFIESYWTDGSSYRWNDNHGELIRCKDCESRLECDY